MSAHIVANSKKDESNNARFILDVVNTITSYTGKQMIRNEVEGLVQYINSLDSTFMSSTPSRAIDTIARNFITHMRMNQSRTIDTHELLKKQIGTISSVEPTGRNLDFSTIRGYGGETYNNERRDTRTYDHKSHRMGRDRYNSLRNGRHEFDRPKQLENISRPFSSALDKYPNIIKQNSVCVYTIRFKVQEFIH